MTENTYDVVVIGGGPGGYVAAIRAGQLGLKVACVEKESRLGGTCLRVGCIPSKALLDASEKFYHAKHGYAALGVAFDGLRLDLPAMMGRKDEIVGKLTGGVSFLLKKNKVEAVVGTARLKSASEVEVTGADGKVRVLRTKNVIVATGSMAVELPFLKFDGKRVISSDQGIALPEVPKEMVVIGAGAIGLELGSVWSRLGAKVTVLEMLPQIVAGADTEMAGQLEKLLRKQGMEIFLEAKVTGAKEEGGRMSVGFEHEGKAQTAAADVVLVAVGRKPYTEGLGAQEAGVNLDGRGRINVNGKYETSLPHVYAIGDVIAGPMLAHKAEDEGVACAENIAGLHGHVNYKVIPGVVYTSPELAWVGMTEEQLQAEKTEYNVGKFKFAANGRALAMDEAEGLVKILASAKTDKVLGVHVLGPQGSSLIAEAAMVMEFGGSAEDIARTCHAHPTLPEVMKEAALAVGRRAIHG